MIAPTDLAWAAGFIDGEGCFGLYQYNDARFRSHLAVGNTVKAAVVRLQTLFHCGWIRSQSPEGKLGNRTVWFWEVAAGKDLLRVLRLIRPFIFLKARQADILAEYLNHVARTPGAPHRISEEDAQSRRVLVNLLHTVKREV